MKRGHTRRLALAVGVVAAIVVASSAAWIGSQRATASSGAVKRRKAGGSGILRIGTTNYIDSFNPWNYIEGQGLNAMVMVYPLLIQIDYSKQKGYYIVGRLGEVVEGFERRQDVDVQAPLERRSGPTAER